MSKDTIEKAIKEAREKGQGKIISRDDIYNAIFKAGKEQGYRDHMTIYDFANATIGMAKQSGKREVVEFVGEEPFEHNYHPQTFEHLENDCLACKWQAQKKIWLK